MSVKVRKGKIAIKKQHEESEKTNVTVNHVNAVTDYNVMMGVLEDPSEGEDDDE